MNGVSLMMVRKVGLVILLIAMAAIWLPRPVLAQSEETPTPTLTATPPYQYAVALSSGSQLVIERRVTYGEIAVVFALGISILIQIFYYLINLLKKWLP
jgi:hypothetical protein